MPPDDILRDALFFLSSHFSTSCSFEDWMAAEPAVRKTFAYQLSPAGRPEGLSLACHSAVSAGAHAGSYLLQRVNYDKFEKAPPLIMPVLYAVGQWYPGLVYHDARCPRKYPDAGASRARKGLAALVRVWEDQSRGTGRLLLSHFAKDIGPLCERLGFILARTHGASMLGSYARMSADEACRFLVRTAEDELGRN